MKRKAFTLIELLVVVAIIGILAAVGVVAYNGYTSSAKKSVSKQNHKSIVQFARLQFLKCMQGDTEVEYEISNGTKSVVSCSDGPIPKHRTGIYEHMNAVGFKNPYDEYLPGYQANSENDKPNRVGTTTVYCENSSGSAGKCIIKTQWTDGEFLIDEIFKE